MSKKRSLEDGNLDDSKSPPRKKQRISNDNNDKSTPKIEELKQKYEKKKQENLVLKQNLLNKVIGIGDESSFPNIEEFVKEYKIFMNQTHNNLLNTLLDILEEIIETDSDEDDENEDDDLNMNDDDDDDDNKPDIESIKFHKIAYQMLYNIISECYKAMITRKNKFYQIIRQLLHMKNDQTSNHKIALFIDSYLQIKWDTFIKNKYYTMKLSENQSSEQNKKKKKKKANEDDMKEDDNDGNNDKNKDIDDGKLIDFEHESIDEIIDNIYDIFKVKLVSDTQHKHSEFFIMCKTRESIDVHHFIGQCCVLFWIMILFKQPILKLSHESFWINQCGEKYTEIDGSIDLKKYIKNNDNKEDKLKQMVKYCGIPGVIVENNEQHNNNKNGIVVLVEPHVFIHHHSSVIHALKV